MKTVSELAGYCPNDERVVSLSMLTSKFVSVGTTYFSRNRRSGSTPNTVLSYGRELLNIAMTSVRYAVNDMTVISSIT